VSAHGADVGAVTTEELTTFSATVSPADADLRWAIDVEADRMVGLRPSSADFNAQRSIVLNEVGVGGPRLAARLRMAAFDIHPYAGTAADADVQRLTLADVERFYAAHYAPRNAILSVDGSFEDTRAIEIIARAFRSVRRHLPSTPAPTAEPPQTGERTVTVRGGESARILAAYRIPSMSHADYPAVELLLRALTQGRGRVRAALVSAGLASSVYSSTRISRYPDLAMIGVVATSDSTLDSARDMLRRTLDRLATEPLTDAEIDGARPSAARSRFDAETASECDLAGDWRLCVIREERMMATSNEHVRRVARTYFVPWNRTVAVSIPAERVVGPATTVGDAASAIRSISIEKTAYDRGERFDPSLESIRKRLIGSRLRSGAEVTLVPKSNAGESVAGRIVLSFGDSASLVGQAAAAEMTSRLLLGGTKRRSSDSIAAELRSLGAQVSITSLPRPALVTVDEFIDLTERGLPWLGIGLDIRFQATRSSVAAVVRLIADVLREPTLDSAQFENLRRQQLAIAQRRHSNATDLLFPTLVPSLASGHPERPLSLAERKAAIERVSWHDVTRFHARFYGASAGHIVIVGDVSPDSVMQVLREGFGDWGERGTLAPVPAAPRLADVATRIVDSMVAPLPGSTFGRIYFATLLPVGPASDDFAALTIANSAFGSSTDSRLFANVRERAGLSYSIGSRLRPRIGEAASLWSIEASYELRDAEKVLRAIRQELDFVRKAGLSSEEVDVVTSGYLARQRLKRGSDAGLADALLFRRIEDLAAFESSIERLTADKVNAVVRRYFDPSRLSILRVVDAAAR
jgi:zinc protease